MDARVKDLQAEARLQDVLYSRSQPKKLGQKV